MPDPHSTPARHRTAIRFTLVALGLLQVFDGLYALLAPTSFYEDFPLGRGWVELLPAYSEHLVRDVGGLFLATGAVLLAAAWVLERRLVIVAAASFLLFSLPHTIYHVLNLGPYSTGDAIANALGLVATVVLPIWVLFELRRQGRHPVVEARSSAPRRRQRPHRRGPRRCPQPARPARLSRVAAPLRGGDRPHAGLRPQPEGDGRLRGFRDRVGALHAGRRAAQAPGAGEGGDGLRLRVVPGLRLLDQRVGGGRRGRPAGAPGLLDQRPLLGAREAGAGLRDRDLAQPGRRSRSALRSSASAGSGPPSWSS